jgi:hypothetical protein
MPERSSPSISTTPTARSWACSTWSTHREAFRPRPPTSRVKPADTFSGGGYNIRSIKFLAGVRDATSAIAAASHIAGIGAVERGNRLVGIRGGSWIRYEALDFGAGVELFQANITCKPSSSGAVEVRLDALDGPSIAQQTIQGAEEAGAFAVTLKAPVATETTGVHDVFLTFTGGRDVAELNWIKFERNSNPPTAAQAQKLK